VVNHYDELLKLCGFEDDEIKREKPRIDQVFQRLELGPEDMKTAERWVRQNHDVELLGLDGIVHCLTHFGFIFILLPLLLYGVLQILWYPRETRRRTGVQCSIAKLSCLINGNHMTYTKPLHIALI
jgi:hypothetical protein